MPITLNELEDAGLQKNGEWLTAATIVVDYLGGMLAVRRQQLKLSQTELGERLGSLEKQARWTKHELAKIERGKRRLKPSEFCLVSTVLELPVQFLDPLMAIGGIETKINGKAKAAAAKCAVRAALTGGRRILELRDVEAVHILNPGQKRVETKADQASMTAIQSVLGADNVFGEGLEFGAKNAGILFNVDPCDGSVNQAQDNPLWVVGIAAGDWDGVRFRPFFGVVFHPATNELFLGFTEAASILIDTARNTLTLLQPSKKTVLDECLVGSHLTSVTQDMQRFVKSPLPQLAVASRRIEMLGCGLLQLCYVASGRMDAFAQASVGGSWDVVPAVPILQGAGAVISTFDGKDVFAVDHTAGVLAAGNYSLHRNIQTVLKIAAVS